MVGLMDDSDFDSKLPEWHKILRELYAGVESGQKNKPGQSNSVANQTE
jgi:hypothetical protein